VLRAIERQGTTNYWDLKLPRQTEDYVPQFMAVLEIVRNPEKYGFDGVEMDDPMEFDQVALKGTVDLRALARISDCSYEDLKSLNPAVLRHAANGANGVTTVRVPAGKGPAILDRLQHGAKLPVVDLSLRHRVQRGETIQRIADDYHVSARRLALLNGIGRKHPLRRGMVLTVPASLDAPAPAVLDAGDPRAATDYVPPRNIAPRTRVQGQSSGEGRVTHTVRRGETLASIAQRYGVKIEDIRRWNRLKSSQVRRGTRLKIRTGTAQETGALPADDVRAAATPAETPATARARSGREADETLDRPALDGPATAESTAPAGASAGRAPSPKPHHVTIVVHHGETLSEIAARHGVSVRRLMKANGLTSARVRAGQRLKLPTS
jgi:membrane-bound lytic murein transglycosylase D